MSVFRVKLTNDRQGTLSGASQRSAYIMGPNRINRILKDGDTFVDCNYWKRFAYPQVSLENAFIEVIEDDGIQYVDFQKTNYPKVYDITAEAGSDYTDNSADISQDTGGSAVFAQITNKGEESVKIKLNNSSDAIFDLSGGHTQVFNAGDVSIGLIQVRNENESAIDIQVLVSIEVISKS